MHMPFSPQGFTLLDSQTLCSVWKICQGYTVNLINDFHTIKLLLTLFCLENLKNKQEEQQTQTQTHKPTKPKKTAKLCHSYDQEEIFNAAGLINIHFFRFWSNTNFISSNVISKINRVIRVHFPNKRMYFLTLNSNFFLNKWINKK